MADGMPSLAASLALISPTKKGAFCRLSKDQCSLFCFAVKIDFDMF